MVMMLASVTIQRECSIQLVARSRDPIQLASFLANFFLLLVSCNLSHTAASREQFIEIFP